MEGEKTDDIAMEVMSIQLGLLDVMKSDISRSHRVGRLLDHDHLSFVSRIGIPGTKFLKTRRAEPQMNETDVCVFKERYFLRNLFKN